MRMRVGGGDDGNMVVGKGSMVMGGRERGKGTWWGGRGRYG